MSRNSINFGHSSRLDYDQCAYDDRLKESTGPLKYIMNTNRLNNCQACLSTYGPRSNYGVSTAVGHRTAPKQDLVGIESILTNRNVKNTKCRDGGVNPVNVNDYKLQHARICNHGLDPIASHLTHPVQNYKELSINRFYDLPNNPQENIFFDFARNTTLEAKDNYVMKTPKLRDQDPALPPRPGLIPKCNFRYPQC